MEIYYQAILIILLFVTVSRFQFIVQMTGDTYYFGGSYPRLYTVLSLFRTKKVTFVYQTKVTFFERSVPVGT